MRLHSINTFKIEREVANVATSFLSEGYIMRFHTSSLSLCFYSLVHSRNGNHIVVAGYPSKNRLVVEKNKKVIIDRPIINRKHE